MYQAFTVIMFLSAMVLQTSVLHLILPTVGVKPDLVVVLIVYLGLVKGPESGCLSGFGFGLIQDASSGQPLGTFALTKTILGFFSGVLGKRLYTQSLFSHLLCVGLGSIFEIFTVSLLRGFLPDWKNVLFYETAYNLLCCPIIVSIFRFADNRFHPKPF